MNRKIRYLAKNVGWMTVSNFSSKILVFLLVPFYTRVLSTSDYGLGDIVYTAMLLLVPLFTSNVAEALLRFVLAEPQSAKRSFSVGIAITASSSIVVFLALFLYLLIGPIDELSMPVAVSAAILFMSSAVYQLFSQFSRGIDEVKTMAFGSIMNSVLLVVLSVVLIFGMNLGVEGYLWSYSLSMVVASLYMAIMVRCWLYFERPTLAHAKSMVSYGLPLSVNTVGWWANSVLGRYFVAFFCGLSATGLLTAAYKIPSIPKTIQQIFVQAWQMSAIKDYDPKDGDGFFSKTYDMTCSASVFIVSVIVLALPLLATVMFSDAYFQAWEVVPLLLLGLVFDGLSSVLGGVFSGAGNSKPIAVSSVVSVVVCVVVCVALVPPWGIFGASIASLASSISIWLIRFRLAKSYIELRVNWVTNLMGLVALSLQAVLAVILSTGVLWYAVQSMFVLAAAILFVREIGVNRIMSLAKRRHD